MTAHVSGQWTKETLKMFAGHLGPSYCHLSGGLGGAGGLGGWGAAGLGGEEKTQKYFCSSRPKYGHLFYDRRGGGEGQMLKCHFFFGGGAARRGKTQKVNWHFVIDESIDYQLFMVHASLLKALGWRPGAGAGMRGGSG